MKNSWCGDTDTIGPSREGSEMDTLKWLSHTRIGILMLLDEFDNDLLTPDDFVALVNILAHIDKMNREAQARARNFSEDIRKEMEERE